VPSAGTEERGILMKGHLRDSHAGRHDLTGEHAFTDAGQIVFALLFAAVWAADTFFLKYTTFLNQYVPLLVRIPAGIAVLCLSGLLARTGLNIVFGEVREKPAVIRKGVFGLMRHPVYFSEVLLYAGMLIVSISLAAAAVWIAAMAFLYYVSRHEEKLLIARFDCRTRRDQIEHLFFLLQR